MDLQSQTLEPSTSGVGDDASQQRFQDAYRDLRALAARMLDRETPGHTLQPTALVHEAYFKLADQRKTDWQSQSQFFAVGATVMRRILVDHARARSTVKRGGEFNRIPLEDGMISNDRDLDVIAVDDALTDLARLDERHAKIVEMRFFGGLTEPQMAEVLKVSERTVRREWRMCQAWLRKRLANT